MQLPETWLAVSPKKFLFLLAPVSGLVFSRGELASVPGLAFLKFLRLAAGHCCAWSGREFQSLRGQELQRRKIQQMRECSVLADTTCARMLRLCSPTRFIRTEKSCCVLRVSTSTLLLKLKWKLVVVGATSEPASSTTAGWFA